VQWARGCWDKDEAEAIQIPAEENLRAVTVKERRKDEPLNDPAVLGIAVGRSEARRQSAAIIVFTAGRGFSREAPSRYSSSTARIAP
jgi:hypothetical protein